MIKLNLYIILILAIVFSSPIYADVIDTSRIIDFTSVGISGGVPSGTWANCTTSGCNTLCCNNSSSCASGCTDAGQTITAASINSAISGATASTVVRLPATTKTLTTGLTMKTGVVLRGAGANQTLLTFSGQTSCGGFNTAVCFIGSTTSLGSGTTVNWTAGYTKGTTTLTLSSTSGITSSANGGYGTMLLLDQLQETTDTGGVWICDGLAVCAYESSASGGQRANRAQGQLVQVTNVSGSDVTISPGLYMPNWASGRTPQASFVSGNALIYNSGIENLSMNLNFVADSGIVMFNSYRTWAKGIRSISPGNFHVTLGVGAKNAVIRDSYFFTNTSETTNQYGIRGYVTSDSLIENNIWHQCAAPLSMDGQGSGTVWAYNYSIYDKWGFDALNYSAWLHGGNDSILAEGNIGNGFAGDTIHGLHDFITLFRNYYNGWETQAANQGQTIPVALGSKNRYWNIVGNVLGRTGYHNKYESTANDYSDLAIISIGWWPYSTQDSLTKTTLMRWGNYDTYNNTVRWESSEVPSGIGTYANAVPGDHVLPNSLYLSAKPSWWGTVAWPPIGPDVTGGNITGVGGYANKIPAQVCYEAMGGNATGTSSVLTFNASTCYVDSASLPSSVSGCIIQGGIIR
jgi:hypothetical protein